MRVSVVKEADGVYAVAVDGEPREVHGLSAPDGFRALQWDGSSGEMELETASGLANEATSDAAMVASIVSAWDAHEPVDWYSTETLDRKRGIVSDTPPAGWTLEKNTNFLRLELREAVKEVRKEKEREGVMVNGIRYSGSAANRQTLIEALQHAERAGVVEFASWVDSDGNFHANHPVSEVEAALDAIAARRSALITYQGQIVAEIDAGTRTDLEGLAWP